MDSRERQAIQQITERVLSLAERVRVAEVRDELSQIAQALTDLLPEDPVARNRPFSVRSRIG